jgi:DNA-binding transcriptional regulator YiaG
MPNVGAVIREEITRLSRRESRSQVAVTKKATVRHRHEIATLKRLVAGLARQVALLNRKILRAPPATAASSSAVDGKKVRFVAKGLRSQRERLRLSQPNLGKLLGVSAQTIYNWEHGESRPRAEQLLKIATLRNIGKRDAAKRLKQLDGNGKRPRKG